MEQDDNRDAGPSALPGSPSDPDHDTSSSAFPLSAKLRDKLNKLADWRLDLSSIEFVNGAPEFRGGYATVSRAFLVSPSSVWDGASPSNSEGEAGLDSPGSAGEASRQDVAVKKMHLSDDPARVLGLTLREAEFLVGLSHENVIELEGFVEDLSKDLVWLVFPWAAHGNLKSFIASADWEIPERIWLISDVADGVEYLHSQQPPIRHGDLKSINILINSEYRAIITDFGSAHRQTIEDLDEETGHAENKPQTALSLEPAFDSTTNTMTITLKGDHFTLRWAAPELLHEKKATLAIDIWALGCVVYEVMTNSIPFHDVKRDSAVILRITMGKLPSITDEARMTLIRALCSLALACWSADPRERPTAEDCQNSISWMPMIKPDPIRIADTAASRARSPALLMELGDMYRQQGDYMNALDFFAKALGSYNEIGDSKGKAAALKELAEAHRFRREYSQAMRFYTEALQIYTDIGNMEGRAAALDGLAGVHRNRDEYSQAVTFYTEALQIRTDFDDRIGRANTLAGLAEVHRIREEYSQAETFYTEVLQISTDIGSRQGRANGLWGLAEVHRLRGEYTQAETFYTEALQINTDIGSRQGRVSALCSLGEMHQARDEYSQAITFYTEALQIYTDIGNSQRRADVLSSLGEVHQAREEYSQAITFYTEALQICTDVGDRQGRADALSRLGQVHQAQDEYSQAITFYTEALQICTDVGDRQGRAGVLSRLGAVHQAQEEYSQAITLYTEALQICTDIGHRQGSAKTLSSLGEVHRDRDEYTQAETFYTKALQIYTDISNSQGRADTLSSLGAVYWDQDEYSQAVKFYTEALQHPICSTYASS